MQTVIDNILINYQVLGEKNEKEILILHGWGRSCREWTEFAKTIASKYHVFILDLPGFGNSAPFSSPANTLDYANLVEKFIGKHCQNLSLLMGHSFGGKIAVIIASKKPSIKKLVLIAPSGTNRPSLFVRFIKFAVILTKPVLIFIPSKIRNIIYQHIGSLDYRQIKSEFLKHTFKKVTNDRIENYASKIKIPTLIIWGELDKTLPLPNSLIFKNLIDKSMLRIVWKAKHDPHLEKPEQFAEVVNEFI